MLRSDPQSRPTVQSLLQDEFFTSGYLPPRLPTTCLTMAPRFAPELLSTAHRKPLHDINNGVYGVVPDELLVFLWFSPHLRNFYYDAGQVQQQYE